MLITIAITLTKSSKIINKTITTKFQQINVVKSK